mgnify:FL=1
MRQLSDFGLPLGEAFQLRDDVLGVFGDPEVTGKPAGDDLREGKRTALIAYAFERASANERGLLAERLGRQDLSAQDIDDMRSIIVSCGALDIVETLISEGRDAALQALSTSSLTPEAVHVLGNLAVAAADRKF